ncbi:hypothetical protein J1N35_029440 [Gossypium stocksii]|uniref:Uncharacterized protein n=1 Tax=Gossypium stocksii TaxID=47602 RepID=A0A9D3UY19_9ROSI|nr:hypothetical protein J1N35_029440 [Gossypium stocksii]
MNVFFSLKVNVPLRNKINDILDFQEVNDLGHYLGVTLLHKRVTKSTLDFLVERVRSRLSSWDAKKLSVVGRGAVEGKRKMALVGWDDIYQPNIHGGLGFHHLEDQNKAFMLKIGYNLITKSEVLWVQVLRAKYGVCENMSDSIMRSSYSYIWRAVAKA